MYLTKFCTILDQREKRHYNKRDSFSQDCRQLKGKRLASTSWYKSQAIFATHGGIDNSFLIFPEFMQTKLFSESAQCSFVPLEGFVVIFLIIRIKQFFILKYLNCANFFVYFSCAFVLIALIFLKLNWLVNNFLGFILAAFHFLKF